MASSTSVLSSTVTDLNCPRIYYQASDDAEYAQLKRTFGDRPYCHLDESARRVCLQTTFQDLLDDDEHKFSYRYRFSSGRVIDPTYENQNLCHLEKHLEKVKMIDDERYFLADLMDCKKRKPRLPNTNIAATEEQVLASQIIIVGASHEDSESQEWITKNLKEDDVILVEFATENKTPDEIKKVFAIVFSALYGSPQVYKSACAMIQRAVDIGAEVLGGENKSSINIQGKANEHRCLWMDAAFTKAISNVLRRKPHARIFCWAGNGHNRGIIENLYAFWPNSIRIAEITPRHGNFYKPMVYVTPGNLALVDEKKAAVLNPAAENTTLQGLLPDLTESKVAGRTGSLSPAETIRGITHIPTSVVTTTMVAVVDDNCKQVQKAESDQTMSCRKYQSSCITWLKILLEVAAMAGGIYLLTSDKLITMFFGALLTNIGLFSSLKISETSYCGRSQITDEEKTRSLIRPSSNPA